jgi:transposase InsO family protein
MQVSTLTLWDKRFDENMQPIMIPDNRGKAGKVTVEMVQRIIHRGKAYHPGRIRLKQFAAELKRHEGIELGTKTLEEILIANDLYKARTRKKQPRYYQSLCRKLPNGLLSIDGSEMIIWLGETPYRFNVELSVDVATFTHTAFSVADSETAEEVIKVLEAHRRKWGVPVGVLSDSGSANLSESVRRYMKDMEIEPVTAGPRNPKGNGTIEGAFSHMKRLLGQIRLDVSSPKALAKNVLETIVSVYIHMRNRLCLRGRGDQTVRHMRGPLSTEPRRAERQRLKDHMAAKAAGEEEQVKLDRLHWVIGHYGLKLTPEEMHRARRTIKGYELEAIRLTETTFLKATQRKSDRLNLPYFFGILKNIQQQRDDNAKRDYCRQRYNHELMLRFERHKDEQPKPASINDVLGMLERAVTVNVQFAKELAIRKARQWTLEVTASCSYLEPIKKKVEEALGNLKHLSVQQRENAWNLFCQFLNANKKESRVTLLS